MVFIQDAIVVSTLVADVLESATMVRTSRMRSVVPIQAYRMTGRVCTLHVEIWE